MIKRKKRKKKIGCELEFTGTGVNLTSLVSFWFVFLEAFTAVDRAASVGLERNLSFFAAVSTGDRVHFTLFIIHTTIS